MLASLAGMLLLAAATPTKAKMVVLELTGGADIETPVKESLTEAITAEVDARSYFEVVSSVEVRTMLSVERQRELTGCSENNCMAELAGALGAPFVLSGSLTRLGTVYQLNLQVIDTTKARPLGRSTKVAHDFEALRATLPWAVAEACGTPLPPAPSRVLPYTLIGAGAAALIAGGVLGIVSLNNESVVRGELSADNDNGTVVLRPASTYRDRLNAIAIQKSISLGALLAGAVLMGIGIWRIPPDAPQTGVRVAVLPSLGGFAIAGLF